LGKTASSNSVSYVWLFQVVRSTVSEYDYDVELHLYRLVKMGAIEMGETVDWCVPTGNFGDILSALYAKLSGLPIGKLICASNENNVLTTFLRTGVYDISERTLQRTTSPSIDILKSSNLERLLHLVTGGKKKQEITGYFKDLETKKMFQVDENILSKLKELFWAEWCCEEESKKRIKSVYEKTGN
jgi:threonine synthase